MKRALLYVALVQEPNNNRSEDYQQQQRIVRTNALALLQTVTRDIPAQIQDVGITVFFS
jgi:hypothetical protein